MRFSHALLSLAALTSLSACIGLGGKSKAPQYLFNLTASQHRPADAGQSVAAGKLLSVTLPTQPRLLATSRIPVINAPNGVAYLADAAWVDTPAPLFQRLLAETITAQHSTGDHIIVALPARQAGSTDGPRLGGELTMFGLDHASNEAVVIYDATLTGPTDVSVRSRRFEHRTPADLSQPRLATKAIEASANAVAAEVATWVAEN